MRERPAPIDRELVESFVANAHGDLDAVRDLLEREPRVVNAAWDWGAGDWETGLGAAAHTGQREIALLLLARGARIDAFAAAMLGEIEIVRAMISSFPNVVDVPGPHGIPLVEHARAGGEQAREVVELLTAAASPTARS